MSDHHSRSDDQQIGDLPERAPTSEQADGVRGGEAIEAQLDDATTADIGIVSPRDAASGLPTGKRQHKPFSV